MFVKFSSLSDKEQLKTINDILTQITDESDCYYTLMSVREDQLCVNCWNPSHVCLCYDDDND